MCSCSSPTCGTGECLRGQGALVLAGALRARDIAQRSRTTAEANQLSAEAHERVDDEHSDRMNLGDR